MNFGRGGRVTAETVAAVREAPYRAFRARLAQSFPGLCWRHDTTRRPHCAALQVLSRFETLRQERAPVSPVPSRTPGADSRNTAAIGKAVKIVGQIITGEDLQIDGDVEGAIEAQDSKVIIGSSGRIQASILAREIVVLGQVQGDIVASDKVELRKDSRLVGDITSPRIVLEDGALVKGKIDTVGARMTEPKSFVVASTQPAASSEVAAGS